MSLTTYTEGEWPTIQVSGDLAAEDIPELRATVASATGQHTRTARIDLGAVTYLPSGAVAELVRLREQAAPAGATLELVAPSGTIAQRVLLVTGVPHDATEVPVAVLRLEPVRD